MMNKIIVLLCVFLIVACKSNDKLASSQEINYSKLAAEFCKCTKIQARQMKQMAEIDTSKIEYDNAFYQEYIKLEKKMASEIIEMNLCTSAIFAKYPDYDQDKLNEYLFKDCSFVATTMREENIAKVEAVVTKFMEASSQDVNYFSELLCSCFKPLDEKDNLSEAEMIVYVNESSRCITHFTIRLQRLEETVKKEIAQKVKEKCGSHYEEISEIFE